MDEYNPFDDLAGVDPETLEAEDEKTERQLEGWVANLAIGLGLLFVLLIVIVVLAIYPTQRITATVTEMNHTFTENETRIEARPEPITFQFLLLDPDTYADTRLTLLGFLQKRELDRGLVKYYLLDDYFRELELRSVPQADRERFPLDAKTKYPYEVTGIVRKSYQSIYLDVETLFITTRPVNETLIVIEHNRSETETLINYSTEKTTVLKYWSARLFGPTKPCADGSAPDSCAQRPPYFCTKRGVLIADPVTCGCPEGKELRGEECV
ncbi:hypothetical protein D6789_02505 [Candidatus Woesearchaeota archaeon]|nr:MAG: hypothetical protein D6789_02505 [Candidatus Woesearchaeota archaeon]